MIPRLSHSSRPPASDAPYIYSQNNGTMDATSNAAIE